MNTANMSNNQKSLYPVNRKHFVTCVCILFCKFICLKAAPRPVTEVTRKVFHCDIQAVFFQTIYYFIM